MLQMICTCMSALCSLHSCQQVLHRLMCMLGLALSTTHKFYISYESFHVPECSVQPALAPAGPAPPHVHAGPGFQRTLAPLPCTRRSRRAAGMSPVQEVGFLTYYKPFIARKHKDVQVHAVDGSYSERAGMKTNTVTRQWAL